MIGVRFRETHDGTLYFLEKPMEERLVRVEVTVTVRADRAFLRDRLAEIVMAVVRHVRRRTMIRSPSLRV